MSTRQPELYCAALITWVATAAALGLRVVARRVTELRLAWDDYLAIFAFVLGTGFTFISLFKMRWGFGLRIADIKDSEADVTRHYFQDLYTDMFLYTFSIGLSKIVILHFYWRMFKHSIIRRAIQVLACLSVMWIVARLVLILMQCRPIHKFWDKTIPGSCPISTNLMLFGVTIPHLLLEVAILICPMVEIKRLQLPRAKKVAVAAMFTSGFLVCGCALANIVHSATLDTKSADLTWDGIEEQIWAVCDVNIAHFSTSLPLLGPIMKLLAGRVKAFSWSDFTSGNGRSRTMTRNRTQNDAETDSTYQLAETTWRHESLSSAEASSKAVTQHDEHDLDERDFDGEGILVKNEIRVGVSAVTT